MKKETKELLSIMPVSAISFFMMMKLMLSACLVTTPALLALIQPPVTPAMRHCIGNWIPPLANANAPSLTMMMELTKWNVNAVKQLASNAKMTLPALIVMQPFFVI